MSDLLDLDGISTRRDLIRFDVYDTSGVRLGDVHPRVRGRIGCSSSGSSPVTRTIRDLVLLAADAAAVGPTDLLRPVWVTEDGTEYGLGYYMAADATRVRRPGGLEPIGGEWTDEGARWQKVPTVPVGFAAGVTPGAALRIALDLAGYPDAVVEASPAPALSEPLAWDPGRTPWWRIFSDLATAGNYWPPYIDADRVPRVELVPDPSALTPSDGADYDERPSRIVSGGLAVMVDLRAPNRFTAVSSGDGAPYVGSYDLPAEAANSAASIGETIVAPYVEVPGPTDQATVDRAARLAAVEATQKAETVAAEAVADPRAGVHDVLQVDGALWVEESWELDLGPGTITRKAGKVYP